MERVYIGMGSNLADPAEQLRSAVESLARLPQSELVGVSGFYQSDSLLPGQPRYTNAVAALDSRLAPLDLLDALQAIENGQGRERL
ncbi:MAG: 2-amino-4-hydroxy-6-hydroxymethyldihydropteridine diphosphokinase, partial [Pseudomonas sp.]